MSKQSSPFHIRKNRNTAAIFKDATAYVAEHANTLFLGILALSMPLILISTYAAESLTEDSRPFDHFLHHKNSLDKPVFIFYYLAFLVYIIGIGVFNLVINKYMVLSGTENKSGELPVFENLAKKFMENLKDSAANFCIVFILSFIVLQVINYFYINQATSVSLDYRGDPVTYYSELFLAYLPTLIVVPFGTYFVMAILFVCYRDHTDTGGALKKVWDFTQKNTGKAWLVSTLLFIVTLILTDIVNRMITLVFGQIFYGLFHLNLFMVSVAIRIIFSFLLLAYLQIANTLLFGSFDGEGEDAYLKTKINEI